MKKALLILATIAIGVVSCKKGSDDGGGGGVQPVVKIEVSNIADNKATVSAALEAGAFRGAKIVTRVRVQTMDIDYTKDIPLVKYVEENGETISSLPYTTEIINLSYEQDYLCAIIVYDATGRACDADYVTFTAVGNPDGISDDNSAGTLEDNPQ